MITLKNIEKVYRTSSIETIALTNINLDIRAGEFLSIMGPSGCGKSTLMNMMGLLDAPSGGSIAIDGQAITQYRDKELARLRNQKIGFIFQSFHLINDLSVLDNVEIPLLYRKGDPAGPSLRGTGSVGASRRALAKEALERVGLSNRVQHFPGQLSGGQKQRVAIARAIVGRPDIVLADEPTGNLDSAMGNEIMAILQQLNIEGSTIIMVTHDEAMARKTHRLIRLFDGAMVDDSVLQTN